VTRYKASRIRLGLIQFNLAKGTMVLYEFFGQKYPRERTFYYIILPLSGNNYNVFAVPKNIEDHI